MGDTLVPSVAAPLLRRLDQTRHYLTYAGDTDRPCQKQIRTRGRKRPVASAIDHPAAPGEAACLYQDGSDAPGPVVKNGTNLETSLYWLLGSSVQKQALREGERTPFPACKHRRVGVESDVVNSRLMLG